MERKLNHKPYSRIFRPSIVLLGAIGPFLSYVAWYLTSSAIFAPYSTLTLAVTWIALGYLLLSLSKDTFLCMVRRDVAGVFGWSLVLAMISLIVVQANAVPLAAWDALGGEWGVHSYAEQAVRIIDPVFGGETPRAPRHPPLVPYILMVGVTLSDLTDSVVSAGALGALLSLGIPVSFICALGLRFHRVSLSPFLCLTFLTVPLLENHVTVFGYPEVFVWALTQILFLTMFLRLTPGFERSFPMLLQTLLVTGLLLFTKSPAVIFAFSAWTAYVLSATSVRMLMKFALVFLVVGGCSALLLEEHGLRYLLPIISEDAGAIYASFSGRLSQVNTSNFLPSLKAIALASFINGSFSVLPLAALVVIVGCLANPKPLSRSVKFLSILLVLMVLAFIFAGLIDYVANNSGWGRDTLLSRSMLPFLAVCPALLLLALISLQKNALYIR